MHDQHTFKFSPEELKKINALLPKGFKFITREELIKKETQRPIQKRKAPVPSIPSIFAEPVNVPVAPVKTRIIEK